MFVEQIYDDLVYHIEVDDHDESENSSFLSELSYYCEEEKKESELVSLRKPKGVNV